MAHVCGEGIMIRSSVCPKSNDKVYEFQLCGKAFNFVGSLRSHEQLNLESQQTTVQEDEIVIERSEVETVGTVIKIEDGNRYENKDSDCQNFKNRLKCKKCPREFTRESTLKGHFCLGAKDRRHTCMMCGESFQFASQLTAHNAAFCNRTSWSCSRCRKDFSDYSLCKNHLLNNCIDKLEKMMFTCSVCGIEMGNLDFFVLHELTHTETKQGRPCIECWNLQCSCKTISVSGGYTDASISQVNDESNCNGTKELVKYTNFYRRLNLRKTHQPCSFCGRSFYNRGYQFRKRHMIHCRSKHQLNTEVATTPYVCSICGSTFTNEDDFKIHYRCHPKQKYSVLRDSNNRYHRNRKSTAVARDSNGVGATPRCHLNQESDAVVRYSNDHRVDTSRFHQNRESDAVETDSNNHGFDATLHCCPTQDSNAAVTDSTYIHACSVCGRIFTNKYELQFHHCTYAEDLVKLSKQFLCEVCGKSFKNSQVFYQHTRLHRKQSWLCDVCGKGFPEKNRLVSHCKIHFPREKPHVCKFCNKAFTNDSSLKIHFRCHTKEKPFSCNVCGKRFAYKCYLPVHMKIHTKEKPFKCNLCDRTFFQQQTLNIHKMTHTGELPFECTICKKRYNQKITLKFHYRTHTREKAYLCKECGKRFYDRLKWKKHEATHKLTAKKKE